MFIPLKDNNPSRTYPVVNITLLLANVVIFLYQLALPPYDQKLFLLSNATIPARIPAFLDGHVGFEAAFLPLVTSMFLHHAPLHIAGNMLFLWIFGDNVEDFFGHGIEDIVLPKNAETLFVVGRDGGVHGGVRLLSR